jgi:hypothetical protein
MAVTTRRQFVQRTAFASASLFGSDARRQKTKSKESSAHRGTAPPALIFEDLSEKERKRTPPAEEKIQLKRKNTSRMKF